MYKIKQIPEDFIVKEISNLKLVDKGNYFYYRLKKKNWNTLDVVKEISKRLRISIKDIGFAGSKDKVAVTEQLISIKGKKIKDLEIKDTSFEFVGQHDQPLTLGDLEGNHFEIVIRNLENLNIQIPDKIINYFGEQRFGKNNVKIGKAIIKKDFKKARELLNLEIANNDYISALKTISKRMLRMYLNAYQSYLWNEGVKQLKSSYEKYPLIGFMTELSSYQDEIQMIIKQQLEKEQLQLKDFIIRQIPELSLEGEDRDIYVRVQEPKIIEKGEDELNQDKYKVKVSFSLRKGSYATEVVKTLMDHSQL